MTGEAIKFAVELLDVYLEMGHGLGAIDEYGNTAVVRHVDNLSHRGDGAEGVGDMCDGDELGSRVEEFLKLIEQNSPASSIGTTRRIVPFSSHRICQGTMLE